MLYKLWKYSHEFHKTFHNNTLNFHNMCIVYLYCSSMQSRYTRPNILILNLQYVLIVYLQYIQIVYNDSIYLSYTYIIRIVYYIVRAHPTVVYKIGHITCETYEFCEPIKNNRAFSQPIRELRQYQANIRRRYKMLPLQYEKWQLQGE